MMSAASNLPDLIIALSRDKVTLDLSEKPDQGRHHWRTSFDVESIFLEEQISQSFDRALLENNHLIDHLPCVEVVLIDRPNVAMPAYYFENSKAAAIASKYLRVRSGDTFTTDSPGTNLYLCYTVPTNILQMLREYYANCNVTHLSTLLWNSLSGYYNNEEQGSITYFTLVKDTLIVLASSNNKLVFSKSFAVSDEADVFYYAIACSRMLRSDEQWLISVENEEASFDMPGNSILKIDQVISLPSMHMLMSQYKSCAS